MADCDRIKEKLSAYIDGAVSPSEKTAIEQHCAACEACTAELLVLKRIASQVRRIEEAQPPAWLARKIMLRVNIEAKLPKDLFHRLFFPLRVKLPLQAVAAVFVTLISVYLYKAVQPDIMPMAPGSVGTAQIVVSEKKEAVATPPEQKKGLETVPSDKPRVMAKKSMPAKTAMPAEQPPAPTAPAAGMLQADTVTQKAESEYVPAPHTAKKTAEPMAVKEEKNFATGYAMKDESRAQSPSPLMFKAKQMAEKDSAEHTMTVTVKDRSRAEKEIKTIVSDLRGKILRTETGENKTVVVIAIQAQQIGTLKERLKKLGELKEKEPVIGEGVVTIQIELISAGK